MNFFNFGSNNSIGTREKRKNLSKSFSEDNLLPRRYISCVKFCYDNVSNPLSKEEKVCLAKCADRNYDQSKSNYVALYALGG